MSFPNSIFQFIETQKSGFKIVIDYYLFDKEKENKELGRIYWRCEKRGECKARAVTNERQLISMAGEHTHASDFQKIEKMRFMAEIRLRAKNTMESTHQILTSRLQNYPSYLAEAFPGMQLVKRTINRVRNKKDAEPSQPSTLNSLIIPEIFQITNSGEQFLFHDSGPTKNRILIFATQRNLNILRDCKDWLADGTFKTSPSIFFQVFTIHGIFSNQPIPLIYALLPNKSKTTYEKFLRAINEKMPGIAPRTLMSDFEIAFKIAFSDVYPSAVQSCCFFHLGQALWRKIQSCGLSNRYKTDSDFSLKIRMLLSLSFVPIEFVTSAFETVKLLYAEETQEIIKYFEEIYIGIKIRGQQRLTPIFPIATWNNYSRVLLKMPRTNNSVEAWHRSFQANVGSDHPTIWKFIKILKREQHFQEAKIAQYCTQNFSRKQKKKYQKIDQCIFDLATKFPNINILEYLRLIALNIQIVV